MSYRPFSIPRNIFFGSGALETLNTLHGKRILIITDTIVSDLGFVERVKKIINPMKAKFMVFDQVEPDPSKSTVWSIFSLAQDFQPDIFIGLGGGSSLDAGKGSWALYEQPDLAKLSVLDVKQELPKRELRHKAKYVAIPTTSGTGSEVTRVAVITDHDVKPHLKVPWFSPHLVPDIAIADPELASSMPPSVTANTGFDALVHAMECYVLDEPSDLIDSLALGAAKTVWKWLPKAVTDGKDMLARSKMHLAALQAGMAFSNGTLWLVHIPAHEIGSNFGIPHGQACALMLCPVFAFLYPTHKERLISLATSLGMAGYDDTIKVNNLLDDLGQLKQKIDIPLTIKDTGLEESSFQAQLDPLINRCIDQISNRAAMYPGRIRPPSATEMRELFVHAWNGTRAEIK